MIEIKSVTKKYGDFTAIEDINIKVENCSVTGVAGYNGAGKTTLLRVIAGIFNPENGHVYLDGAESFDNDVERKRLFYLPDEMWFPTGATVESAAKYYAGYYPEFDMAVFSKVCEIFGLDKKKRIRALSKGMTRQAGIAIAFGAKPKYLLIDETFDGLDPQKKFLLRKLMLEFIAETDASVIITSHDLGEISGVCDHIVLINGKHVQLNCAIENVSENFRRVKASFDKNVEVSDFDSINHKSLKIAGKNAFMLIYGDIEKELEKIKNLGANDIEDENLTLEEVFNAELDIKDNDKISTVFSKDGEK